jgi:hypothetical protein
MKLIESPWELATATERPSGLTASMDGARPTATSRTESSFRPITLTVPVVVAPVSGSVSMAEPLLAAVISRGLGRRPPRLLTNTRPSASATATPKGAMPTGISRSTLRAWASTIATVLLRLSAT